MGNSLEREVGEAILAFRYVQFSGNNDFFKAILKLPPELIEAVEGSLAGPAGSAGTANPSALPPLHISDELRSWLDHYLEEAEALREAAANQQTQSSQHSHSPPADRRRSGNAVAPAPQAGAGSAGTVAAPNNIGELSELPEPFRFQDLQSAVGGNLSAAVRRLNLCAQGFVEVTPALGLLGGYCHQLALCCNRLNYLPPEIGYLKNLTVLSLSRNRLTDLPDTMAYLVHLKELSVSNNFLKTFNPVVASGLIKLTDLSLHNNQITHLPPEMSKMQALVQLNLCDNPITALPAEIARLRHLRVLGLDRCPLASRKDWQVNTPLWEMPRNRSNPVLPGDRGAPLPSASEFNPAPLWGGLNRMSRSSSQNQLGNADDIDMLHDHQQFNDPGAPGEPTSPNSSRRAGAVPPPSTNVLAPTIQPTLLTLKELCARAVVRNGLEVPADYPAELRSYLAGAKMCSFCGGPYFESFVMRAHFMIKNEVWVPLVHTLCMPHWNTERERQSALFQPRPSTSPKTLSRSGSFSDLQLPELPPISVPGSSGSAVQGLKRSGSGLGSGIFRRLARSGSNLSLSRNLGGASRGELNAAPPVAGGAGAIPERPVSRGTSTTNLSSSGSPRTSSRLSRAASLNNLNVGRPDSLLANVLSATRTES